MAEIMLRAEDARSYASEVKRASDEANDTIVSLSARLDSLSEAFRGAAKDKFDQKYGEWRDGQQKAKTALDELSDWLGKAADEIERVDQSLASGLG